MLQKLKICHKSLSRSACTLFNQALLTLGIEYPISSVSFVVQWKTLSGTVLATLCTSWITAWEKQDCLMVCKQQQHAQTQVQNMLL